MGSMSQEPYRFQYLEEQPNKSSKKKPDKKAPPKKRGCLMLLWVWTSRLILFGIIMGLLAFAGGYFYLSNQLSDAIDQVTTYRGTGIGGTPRFFDRNGELLFELKTTEKRRWLAYHEIPLPVLNATVTVEDDTFWSNPGFDPSAIGAAVVRNYRNPNGRPVGASTITQQLVRHIVFSYEERVGTSYERKVREIFLAYIMTQQRSKQEVIQMYLNEIYYGNLAYGIEAAAQTYFGKSATDLNLAESAFLAGLPQSPLDWDPYTNFEGAKNRQEFILDLMVEDGTADYIEAEVAKGTTLHLQPRITIVEETADVVLQAPHFILYVQHELEQKYGPDALTRGGWQITTSLDMNMQRLAEQAAREQVASRSAQHDVNNASVVALKPKTGEILAMVGSLDYFDATIDGQVNVALSPRQPGSSIKPITFVSAMQQGWTTGDVLWDVPIRLDLGGGQYMVPVNYDGYYHGPTLFRDALANSYNIPPIQLIRDVGVAQMIATARQMGVESLDAGASYYGLALTLGGGEVPLIEMTHAYATLANGGQRPLLTSVLSITDSRGNPIYDRAQERLPASNAIDPRIAYIITDILDDDQARIPAMGRGSALELAFPAAVKTGTTNDYRDNWTIGYTPSLVVGVWSGNTDGHPMIDSSGLRGTAPIWKRVMEEVYANPALTQHLQVDGQLLTEFIRPDGIEERTVCLPASTGGAGCGASRTDLFIANKAARGNNRVSYSINRDANEGAWTLAVLPLPSDIAVDVARPELDDGARPPLPTLCVVNMARPPENISTRLFLPIPPDYGDEVRARLWAQSRGYQMAPPTICPLSLVREVTGGNLTSGNNNNSSSSNNSNTLPNPTLVPPQSVLETRITSPVTNQLLRGNVPVLGTAVFDSTVSYYIVQLGAGENPSDWLTIGQTHAQPVRSGLLETISIEGYNAGTYTLRLLLIGTDGNPAGQPATVLVRIE